MEIFVDSALDLETCIIIPINHHDMQTSSVDGLGKEGGLKVEK